MKNLIVALLAVFTLMTSLLSPVPALALSSPDISFETPHSLPMVFMTKKVDAKAKNVEGRMQSASGDLTGTSGDKIKGAAKQVQGLAKNTAPQLTHSTPGGANQERWGWMPLFRGIPLTALAFHQLSIQTLNKRSIAMRRENQIWLTGVIVAVIGFGSSVVINQRG